MSGGKSEFDYEKEWERKFGFRSGEIPSFSSIFGGGETLFTELSKRISEDPENTAWLDQWLDKLLREAMPGYRIPEWMGSDWENEPAGGPAGQSAQGDTPPPGGEKRRAGEDQPAAAQLPAANPFSGRKPVKGLAAGSKKRQTVKVKAGEQPFAYSITEGGGRLTVIVQQPSGIRPGEIELAAERSSIRLSGSRIGGKQIIRLFRPIRPGSCRMTRENGSLVIRADLARR
ncbi:hypothetical protein P4H65_17090 [Paenibacillus chitinolyticus]|uniref:hypothetical protein n=1 Tax=Paenibacillus chitinolyticus TaxID=79263 RepID=UPI002DBD0E62|nr:hypothetical protein [Paenibacillus chitinolyticus]MEC0247506.1 hypothetical protein [Paenibacillus chitinolyticus]